MEPISSIGQLESLVTVLVAFATGFGYLWRLHNQAARERQMLWLGVFGDRERDYVGARRQAQLNEEQIEELYDRFENDPPIRRDGFRVRYPYLENPGPPPTVPSERLRRRLLVVKHWLGDRLP